MDFDLGRTYDVVTCLFSAIGIIKTYEQLVRAVACMARDVRLGGALMIEPWFTVDEWHPGRPLILVGEKIANSAIQIHVMIRLSINRKRPPRCSSLHDTG